LKKFVMAGLVPATHEHRTQLGAASRASIKPLNAVRRAARGAESCAMESAEFMGGPPSLKLRRVSVSAKSVEALAKTDRHRAGHDGF
jgi:hypothetical protein